MLHVIGVGPGQEEWLPPIIKRIVAGCDIIFGGERALQLFPSFPRREKLNGNLATGMQAIKASLAAGFNVGVLVSGDPGFFSLLPALQRELPNEEILVHPGISSLQLIFARAGLSWQEASFVSVHGRSLEVLPWVIERPLAVLTGGEHSPQAVAQVLLERGMNPEIWVGNALGYAEEVFMLIPATDLAAFPQPLANAILVIEPPTPLPDAAPVKWRFGIPDEEFIRGEVPMTKVEIRVQVLARANIAPTDRVVDVGAGTGSISVEAARLACRGEVFAVDSDPEAVELIQRNRERFGVPNLRVIAGAAPDALASLPPVDVAIVGGSHGQLRAILESLPLKPGGRLVLTAVTLETLNRGLDIVAGGGYEDVEVLSLQATRWPLKGKVHLAQSLNQVFILAAQRGRAGE